MIDDTQIRKGLRQKLLALGYVDADPDGSWANVALENRVYSPRTDAQGDPIPWFRETIMHGGQRQISKGYSRTTGIIQLDYFVPSGTGAYEPDGVATDIKNDFINVVLNGGIRIFRTQRLTGDQQPEYYMVPIELHYRWTSKTK